jgi:hypothetical protein
MVVLRPRAFAESLAAGRIRGGDSRQNSKGHSHALILGVLLSLAGGDLRDL